MSYDTNRARELAANYRPWASDDIGAARGALQSLADEVERLHTKLSETNRVGAQGMTKKCDEVERLEEENMRLRDAELERNLRAAAFEEGT